MVRKPAFSLSPRDCQPPAATIRRTLPQAQQVLSGTTIGWVEPQRLLQRLHSSVQVAKFCETLSKKCRRGMAPRIQLHDPAEVIRSPIVIAELAVYDATIKQGTDESWILPE